CGESNRNCQLIFGPTPPTNILVVISPSIIFLDPSPPSGPPLFSWDTENMFSKVVTSLISTNSDTKRFMSATDPLAVVSLSWISLKVPGSKVRSIVLSVLRIAPEDLYPSRHSVLLTAILVVKERFSLPAPRVLVFTLIRLAAEIRIVSSRCAQYPSPFRATIFTTYVPVFKKVCDGAATEDVLSSPKDQRVSMKLVPLLSNL